MPLACVISFWACLLGVNNGFTLPKIAVLVAGFVIFTLRLRPRALAFVIVAAISMWYSDMPSLSLWGFPGNPQSAGEWSGGLLAICFYAMLTTARVNSLSWLWWAGAALSVHAVLQVYGLDPRIPAAILPQGNAVTWEGSKVDTGALLAMAGAVAPLAWQPLIGCGMIVCGSRMAPVAALFGLAPKKWRLWMLPALIAAPFLLHAPKDIARVELWKIALTGFAERPFIGHGPDSYKLVFETHKTPRLIAAVGTNYTQAHAHNDVLEVLCCLGLLGLVAYSLLLWPLRASAPLMALFVYLKFNPVSFEVMSCAALVAAHHLQEPDA